MKNFIIASRPKTLIVSVAPPMVAYFYGLKLNNQIPLYLLLCTIFSAMLIQMATNFFNDLIDHQKGSDLVRVGPQRVTASGLVSESTIKSWAYGSLVGALLFAIPVVIHGGPIILILGLVSLYLSYGYTGGIVSLAYRGLGELFVFLFFGLFSFLGSLFVFTQTISITSTVLACQMGLLAVTFIGINNLRDRELDSKVNKRTLATRMSVTSYRLLIACTILIPYFLSALIAMGTSISFLGLLIAVPFCVLIFKKEGRDLNVGLKISALHLIVFSIFTILDINYGRLL